jgi:hypothetical protein
MSIELGAPGLGNPDRDADRPFHGDSSSAAILGPA